MRYLLVFLATLLVDIVWTKYIAEVAAKRAWHAASWSSVIIAMAAFTTTQYVHDGKMLIPAILGAFVGTYIAVWKEALKPQEKP